MSIKEVNQLHEDAMEHAVQAELHRFAKKTDLAKQSLRAALRLEKQAAIACSDLHGIEVEPTRSILFRSAASLAIDCEEWEEARILIDEGKAANCPLSVKDELDELSKLLPPRPSTSVSVGFMPPGSYIHHNTLVGVDPRLTIADMSQHTGQLPFCYCGLFDDRVSSFYTDFNSEDLFKRILERSLFFGGGLYINDHHLLLNPVARKQMMDSESLLSVMIEQGFVRILTREPSALEMASLPRRQVRSFEEFAKSDEWRDFRAAWAQICVVAFEQGYIEKWPNFNLSRGLSLLLGRILQQEPQNMGLRVDKKILERIHQEFLRETEHGSAPRSKFEYAARKVLKERGVDYSMDMRSLMQVANEAYNYSFGASLSYKLGKPITVDTTVSPAFDDLINKPEINYRKFMSIPSIGIPLSADLSRGKQLVDLMIPGTEAFAAKQRFIGLFLDSNRVADSSVDSWSTKVIELAELYARSLSELLNRPIDELLDADSLWQLALTPSATVGFEATAMSLPSVSTSFTIGRKETVSCRLAQFSIPSEETEQRWKFAENIRVAQLSSVSISTERIEEVAIASQ